jgi:hypothetical protein
MPFGDGIHPGSDVFHQRRLNIPEENQRQVDIRGRRPPAIQLPGLKLTLNMLQEGGHRLRNGYGDKCT